MADGNNGDNELRKRLYEAEKEDTQLGSINRFRKLHVGENCYGLAMPQAGWVRLHLTVWWKVQFYEEEGQNELRSDTLQSVRRLVM